MYHEINSIYKVSGNVNWKIFKLGTFLCSVIREMHMAGAYLNINLDRSLS